MQLTVERSSMASASSIWRVFVELEHAAERISAIQAVEIVKRPDSGLEGTEWLETRLMFGRASTEQMQISHVVEGQLVEVDSSASGCRFVSKMTLQDNGDKRIIGMSFEAFPTNIFARLIMKFLGAKMLKDISRMIEQDLQDIDTAAVTLDQDVARGTHS